MTNITDTFAGWLFAYGAFYICLALLVGGTAASFKQHKFPTWFVLFLAALSMFWQETYGDWGAYLLYNPEFPQMPWGHTPYTAPSKPWGILPGYGWFYLLWAVSTAPILKRVLAAKPGWPPFLTSVLLTVPLWYGYEILIEGGAAANNIWSYTMQFGPALHFEKGSFPLMWPLLAQVPFHALLMWLMAMRDGNGMTPLDRFVPVASPRDAPVAFDWGYNITRVLVWCIAFNIGLGSVANGPLVLFRMFWGPASAIVP